MLLFGVLNLLASANPLVLGRRRLPFLARTRIHVRVALPPNPDATRGHGGIEIIADETTDHRPPTTDRSPYSPQLPTLQ